MGLKTGNFRLQKRDYVGLSVSGVLQREECDIDALFFLSSGFTLLPLCLLRSFYTFALPSFISCSRLHLNLIYTVPFTYVRCYLLVLFVILKNNFFPGSELHFFKDRELAVYSYGVFSTNPVPCPLASHACASSAPQSVSAVLCSCTKPLFLCMVLES